MARDAAPFEPRWDAEIDVDGYLASIPKTVTTKGLFLNGLADRMEEAGAARPGRWTAFGDYPVADYTALLVECARAVHPTLSLGRALRRIGHTAYPTFAGTTIGKVIFTFAGRDPRAALRLAPRAYAIVSGGAAQVTLVEGADVDILKMRGIFSFPEYHEVGVIEGGIREFGGDAAIHVAPIAPEAVDLHITWRRS